MSYAIIDLKKKKFLNTIEVTEICNELEVKVPKFKENKQQKYAKKINKILKKYRVNNVVLSTELKNAVDFQNRIMENNNYIIKGNSL